jgi:hypothetical protein
MGGGGLYALVRAWLSDEEAIVDQSGRQESQGAGGGGDARLLQYAYNN